MELKNSRYASSELGAQKCLFELSFPKEFLAFKGHTRFMLLNRDISFPGGGNEYNHISNVKFGSLKDNPERACPIDIPYESQKMQCVSLEESVWGTKLLAELESIKKEVDPKNGITDVLLVIVICRDRMESRYERNNASTYKSLISISSNYLYHIDFELK